MCACVRACGAVRLHTENLLSKNIAKGKITEQLAKETKSRISTSTDIAKLDGVDFIVEAASENVAIKEKIFKYAREISVCLAPFTLLSDNLLPQGLVSGCQA